MRRLLLVILLIAALLAACSDRDDDPAARPASPTETASSSSQPSASPTTSPSRTAAPSASTTAPAGPDQHNAGRAMDDLEELAEDIGPRVAGSPAEQEAIDEIVAEFEEAGYETEVLPFAFTSDRYAIGSVRADDDSYSAIPFEGSDSGSVTGPSAWVGIANAGDLEGIDLTGKVAVALRGTIPFAEKYENVRAAGAIALVVINDQPGAFSGTLGTTSLFPTVGIAQEDGGDIREAAEEGGELTVEVQADPVKQSANVLARAPGTDRCEILVGAHHDTVPEAPGANDNASGVANVIEIARSMAADGPDDGLCFATFGAEEWGLFGSRALADQMAADGQLPNIMVNFDVTGVGEQVLLVGDDALKSQAVALADDLGIPAEPYALPPGTGSDHESFQQAGVPVLFFTSGEFSTIHTPADTFDAIQQPELDRIGEVGVAMIQQLLNEGAGADD